MNKIIRFLKSRAYGICWATAYRFQIFLFFLFKNTEPFNQLPEFINIIKYIYIFCLIGARLAFCLGDSNQRFSFKHFIQIYKGGQSYYGAIFVAPCYLIITGKMYNYNLLSYFDAAVFMVPIAQIMVRFGNFINQRIKGRKKKYSNYISLIEMVLHGIIPQLIILYIHKYHYAPGILTTFYFKYYSVIRFISDFFRIKQKHYNLYLGNLQINIWQTCSLFFINPYFLLFIIDQYLKQKIPLVADKLRPKKMPSSKIIGLLFIFSYFWNTNIIYFMGLISILCDYISNGYAKKYLLYPPIHNLGYIYIIVGAVFHYLRINICKSVFDFDNALFLITYGNIMMYTFLFLFDQGLKFYVPTISRNKGVCFGIKIKYTSKVHGMALLLGFYYQVSPLILIGGFSNWIDRLFYGHVRDHIRIQNKYLGHSVFNLADVYICIGFALNYLSQFKTFYT